MNAPHDSLAPPAFPATHWSGVLRATGDSPVEAAAALEALCRTYWPPVYAFIRRLGYDGTQAKDLTQAFFAHLLQSDFFATADRDQGRFRGYLQQSCRLFLGNEWQKRTAEKRGGGQALLPWESLSPEDERQFATPADPATDFDRQWALALLRSALGRLEAEHRTAEERRQFELLRPFLTTRPNAGDYDHLATQLGVARGTVQARLDRLVQRGVIASFAPTLDPAALGYPVTAFVTLEIRQGRGRAVQAHLNSIPEVLEVHTITGQGDMLCRVVAGSHEDLQRVLDRLTESADIVRSSTVIALTNPISHRVLPLVTGD